MTSSFPQIVVVHLMTTNDWILQIILGKDVEVVMTKLKVLHRHIHEGVPYRLKNLKTESRPRVRIGHFRHTNRVTASANVLGLCTTRTIVNHETGHDHFHTHYVNSHKQPTTQRQVDDRRLEY